MLEKADSAKQYQLMRTTPIPRLILGMSWPSVISMIITLIYNTADTYFVSHIDASASAAVGAVYAIMAILQALGFGLAMGSSSIISRKLGQKKDDEAQVYFASAFFASVGAGVIAGGLGLLFLNPLLKVLGCSATMMPYATPYAMWILIAAPVSCSVNVLNSTLRAGGQVAIAMIGVGLGGLINLALDPLFIFTLGMGTGGAALATDVSNAISFLILLAVFLTKRAVVPRRLKAISGQWRTYRDVITTGLPTVFRQGLGSLAAAVTTVQAVVYGDAVVAAVNIAGKVYILMRNIIIGIGQGFVPVAGYNFGAGDRERTWQSFTFTVKLGTLLCLGATVLVALFPAPIMRWFSEDEEVVRIGVEILYFTAAVMP
ncbi:MAG: MATE family efflux transporter, partial [Clostridia bacterium]|nr:MATE family efflux transporter [Clostridia bacterium]